MINKFTGAGILAPGMEAEAMKDVLISIAETIAEKTGADFWDVLEDLEEAGDSIKKYFVLAYMEEVEKNG